jgi:hypothetical protein
MPIDVLLADLTEIKKKNVYQRIEVRSKSRKIGKPIKFLDILVMKWTQWPKKEGWVGMGYDD